MKNIFDYNPRTFMEVSNDEMVKHREVIEETHVEHSCYSRQTKWITEKYIQGILVNIQITLGPLTFINYKQNN